MPSSLKSYVGKYIVFVQYCSSVAPKLAKYDDTIYVCICWKKNSNKYSKTQVSRYDKGHSVHAGMLQHVEIFTQNPRYYNFRFTLLFLRGSLAERIDALHRRSMREWPYPQLYLLLVRYEHNIWKSLLWYTKVYRCPLYRCSRKYLPSPSRIFFHLSRCSVRCYSQCRASYSFLRLLRIFESFSFHRADLIRILI